MGEKKRKYSKGNNRKNKRGGNGKKRAMNECGYQPDGCKRELRVREPETEEAGGSERDCMIRKKRELLTTGRWSLRRVTRCGGDGMM